MTVDRFAKVVGITLDAGALIGFERQDRQIAKLLENARKRELALVIPAGVIGQVWRDGRRQARLAGLLRSQDVEIEPLDELLARAAGQLCGLRGTSDVIDASVVLCARRRGYHVATSAPEDLERLDPTVALIVV